jgi:hypothetical protein
VATLLSNVAVAAVRTCSWAFVRAADSMAVLAVWAVHVQCGGGQVHGFATACLTVNGVADRDGSSTDDPLGTRDDRGELGSSDKQAGERLPCGCVS